MGAAVILSSALLLLASDVSSIAHVNNSGYSRTIRVTPLGDIRVAVLSNGEVWETSENDAPVFGRSTRHFHLDADKVLHVRRDGDVETRVYLNQVAGQGQDLQALGRVAQEDIDDLKAIVVGGPEQILDPGSFSTLTGSSPLDTSGGDVDVTINGFSIVIPQGEVAAIACVRIDAQNAGVTATQNAGIITLTSTTAGPAVPTVGGMSTVWLIGEAPITTPGESSTIQPATGLVNVVDDLKGRMTAAEVTTKQNFLVDVPAIASSVTGYTGLDFTEDIDLTALFGSSIVLYAPDLGASGSYAFTDAASGQKDDLIAALGAAGFTVTGMPGGLRIVREDGYSFGVYVGDSVAYLIGISNGTSVENGRVEGPRDLTTVEAIEYLLSK